MLHYRYLDIIEPTIGIFILILTYAEGRTKQRRSRDHGRGLFLLPQLLRARDVLTYMSISLNTGVIYKYKYLHESVSIYIYPSLSVVVLTASKCFLSPLASY